MIVLLFSGAVIAFTASVILTPAAAVAMTRLGVTDRPDGRRKLHGREVPLAGGLAVGAATLAGTALAAGVAEAASPFGDRSFWGWFFAAACVLAGVGLVDDAYRLRGRQKLLGQILAASLLVGSGLMIRRIGLFGWDVELGVVAVPFTIFWLLGAINAINLIDGMDGLAATVGGMIGLALSVLAGMNGHAGEAAAAAALAGGLAGFLIYNFPPAKVFLGDTGSMLVGLVLGVVAVRSSLKESATFAAAAPLALWTLPFLDVSMAVLRRKLTGRSIYETDRGHLHHRLGDRGLGARGSLALVAALCGVTTAGAVGSVALGWEWLAPASAAAVVLSLVVSRSFGHSEVALLARRTRSFASSLVFARGGPAGREHRSQIQGSREWDRLWETLVASAARFGLDEIQMHISLPAAHEEFYAGWHRPVGGDEARPLYRAELPLCSAGGPIGLLRVAGRIPSGEDVSWVADVVRGLRPFETQVADLLFPADELSATRASRDPDRPKGRVFAEPELVASWREGLTVTDGTDRS